MAGELHDTMELYYCLHSLSNHRYRYSIYTCMVELKVPLSLYIVCHFGPMGGPTLCTNRKPVPLHSSRSGVQREDSGAKPVHFTFVALALSWLCKSFSMVAKYRTVSQHKENRHFAAVDSVVGNGVLKKLRCCVR